MQWICCQIGAREHYAIPRVLNRSRDLALLITDAWADTRLPWKLSARSRAAERHHPDIPSRLVESFDWQLLRFELSARLRFSGWAATMARNQWFQTQAIAALRRFRDRNPGQRYTLFSYSYAAAKLFEFARESGWATVLGQMDPGLYEEKLVTELHRRAGLGQAPNPAPPPYWAGWSEECRLADRIVVNSDWSSRGLQAEGVPGGKIQVVPLGYDPPVGSASFVRRYPPAFNFERPLRILFLGQVNVRKGFHEILGAISGVRKLPVEFWIVGDVQLPIPPEYKQNPRVRWFGAVPRGATTRFYRDADVFLFPTLSDGFGLTQLEAQAWRLPVIASRQCGDVVNHGVNGYLLPEVSADAICQAIENLLAEPAALEGLAERSRTSEFTLDQLYARLCQTEKTSKLCWNN